MCCFSGPVQSVSSTKIFARGAEKGRQLLAYEMAFATKEPVAMILPLPVPPGSPENAVRFIDLSGYPAFFSDLKALFPEPMTKGLRLASVDRLGAAPEGLHVAEVGSFEASFVPGLKDFGRLDARFRLSDAVWKKLPQYADYGFAVFKLKADKKSLHPMAFEFPRRAADKLFFPTVHVHDGTVHAEANFDHWLYCQRADGEAHLSKPWRESEANAGRTVKVDLTQGLVAAAGHVYLQSIHGSQKNEDIVA